MSVNYPTCLSALPDTISELFLFLVSETSQTTSMPSLPVFF